MHNRRSIDASLRKVGAAVVVVGLVLSWWQTAAAQQDSGAMQLHKAELEIQKLGFEVAKLKKESVDWFQGHQGLTAFLALVTGIVSGVVGTALTVLATSRARAGATDQATHEKRLEYYPRFVKPTSRLALYFPDESLDPHGCRAMGRAMSDWYFEGGLLLSEEARNAYFRLARALTRASSAEVLKVPKFPNDAEDISVEKIAKYRSELKQEKLDLDDVEKWTFGSPPSETEAPVPKPYLEFKDYVFLQRLSSRLRTMLSEDLRSRRRPS